MFFIISLFAQRLGEVKAQGSKRGVPQDRHPDGRPQLCGIVDSAARACGIVQPPDRTYIEESPALDAVFLGQAQREIGLKPRHRKQVAAKRVVIRSRKVARADLLIGLRDAAFVPFFGVQTATLMSLSRLARLGRARVVPVVSRLTREGYEVTVMSPWANYPTDDPEADTAAMNLYLEGFIRRAPEQYYWVHKRFKTRPEGEPSFYADL